MSSALAPRLCGETTPNPPKPRNAELPGPNFDIPQPKPPRPKCSWWAAAFHFGATDIKLAETVWAEFSGKGAKSIVEGVAIAFVIKNRLWFLNFPALTDTLGLGPRGATIEQVLGQAGQFPEYQADGKLIPAFQRNYDAAMDSAIGSDECDKLIKAYTIVSAINTGAFRDPLTAQGGGWFFQQGSSSPCPICQLLIKIDVHNFWTIPYTNYTGGVQAPWY